MEVLSDPNRCREITDKYPDYFGALDAPEWFANKNNFAFLEGDNVSFAEWKSPGVYWVHFCFDEARGREAILLTKRMLAFFYETCPDAVTSIGLIETKNRPARWLIRQVGFKSLGEVDTLNGPCEMFYYTKEI